MANGWPPVWWVGCHGGAGTSTLTRLTRVGVDATTIWPQPEPDWPATQVVLVCRATATGTWAATGAVDQWRRRGTPAGTRVLGLAVVAASPRRPPRIVTERLQLLAGWVPTVWNVGWVETYLAADDPLELGMPPDVDALRHAVQKAAHLQTGRQ